MRTIGLLAVILTALGITGRSYADPPERQVNIRREYRESEAPDHLIFVSHISTMKEVAAFNRNVAIGMVQEHMHFESAEAADPFLTNMIAIADERHEARDKIWVETICRPDAPRDKEALYRLLDQVDDLALIKAHNIYVAFLSTLDARQQDALIAWLQEEKEGFYYRAAEHESIFEASGGDVVERVQVICATRVEQ
jgi:hypothetical protein